MADSPGGPGGPGWQNTVGIGTGGPGGTSAWGGGNPGAAPQLTRIGPGVPAGPTAGPGAGQGAPTAEQVWRQGLPAATPARNPALRPIIGTVISVVLLIAAVAVIIARLHHPAFGVNGVSITGQTRQGCTMNVTGRIDTSGGSGAVSYEWMFQPQLSAPQALSQSVSAGQTAVYVTAAVEGRGHGSMAQTVTLRVLGPGTARETSARVVVSC
jgi:hypothetical protein